MCTGHCAEMLPACLLSPSLLFLCLDWHLSCLLPIASCLLLPVASCLSIAASLLPSWDLLGLSSGVSPFFTAPFRCKWAACANAGRGRLALAVGCVAHWAPYSRAPSASFQVRFKTLLASDAQLQRERPTAPRAPGFIPIRAFSSCLVFEILASAWLWSTKYDV